MEQQTTAVSLALTRDMIYGSQSPRNLIELPAVKDNWIKQYSLVTGNADGALRYEAERVMFMQAVSENDKLAACDLMTLYAAWIELAVSGLSLRDGMSYILPYNGKADWQPGWKGRLEQMMQLPHINYVDEPILVYDCDKFVYTRGEETRIREHTPKFPRPAAAKIVFVYLTITLADGLIKIHIMDSAEVYGIRDRYSQSYKTYLKKKADGSWKDWMDGGIWLTNEGQAFRKTLVKRVYNNGKKLPNQRFLDQRLKERELAGRPEVDDSSSPNKLSDAFEIVDNSVVDKSNGEIVGAAPVTVDATYTEVKPEQQAPPAPVQQQPVNTFVEPISDASNVIKQAPAPPLPANYQQPQTGSVDPSPQHFQEVVLQPDPNQQNMFNNQGAQNEGIPDLDIPTDGGF